MKKFFNSALAAFGTAAAQLAAIAIFAAVVAIYAAGCNPKTSAATPGMAAKQYVEQIARGDYESFVEAIEFTEPVPQQEKRAVNRAHAQSLRAIQQPDIAVHGGIREVKVVSEKTSDDNKTCDVVVANQYNDGTVKTVNLHMVNNYDEWKIRETPHKEIWRATNSLGDTEVVKIRSGRARDVLKGKNKTTGEKEFIKDINRRGGEVEVIKVLENGQRHKEVIRMTPDGTLIEQVK